MEFAALVDKSATSYAACAALGSSVQSFDPSKIAADTRDTLVCSRETASASLLLPNLRDRYIRASALLLSVGASFDAPALAHHP